MSSDTPAGRRARLAAMLASPLFAALLAAPGSAFATVTGRIDGPLGNEAYERVDFTCDGSPTCTGQYTEDFRVTGCSNSLVFSGTITITGLDTSRSGTLTGNITMSAWDYEIESQADGTCRIKPETIGPATFPYTGSYDSATRRGSLGMTIDSYTVPGTFTSTTSAPPPVFPMVVRSNIDAVSATAVADINFRPQDIGQRQSIFVFALAPANRVIGAQGAMEFGYARGPDGKSNHTIACVLAQLNAAGQMVAVTSANLQAYLTTTLSAAGASVNILNGVPTVNVAGSTFFVGYGTSGTSMINGGVNRSAVTVPGSNVCNPQPPQTGWWWNPLEDGRGFSLEVRGSNLFFAAFLYDISGRSTWYVSTGPVSLNGSYYTGDLLSARGGQTLGGAYPGFPTLSSVGNITLTFNDAGTGTMVWPGGTVPIQRFNIVPNGAVQGAAAGMPENGWWWNDQEPGRGFFLEWQGNTLDIAGYMYDQNGNSVWYLTVGPQSADARTFSGTWWSYGNGQTLTGPWRQNARVDANVAPLTITFSGPETALMTLPNGRTTQLRRHRF